MRFCWNCGSQVEDSMKFCGNCGANMATVPPPPAGQPPTMPAETPKQEQPASVAQPSAAKEEPKAKPVKASGSGRSPVFYAISAVLVVALIALGALYGMGVGKLNKANTQITELEANVASLQTQLTAEQAHATDLQTQLTAEKAHAADLQTQLTTAKSDLTASQAKVTSLTSDLAAANAKVTGLTSDLATANAKVTSTQTSLDKANADLAAAIVTNTSQAAELLKIKDPRTFNTVTELTAWLAKDDTNTNPQYASSNLIQKAYILQIKALRDGYLLSVSTDTDGINFYVINEAIIGSSMYLISASTDQILLYMSGFSPMPSHPLPLS